MEKLVLLLKPFSELGKSTKYQERCLPSKIRVGEEHDFLVEKDLKEFRAQSNAYIARINGTKDVVEVAEVKILSFKNDPRFVGGYTHGRYKILEVVE